MNGMTETTEDYTEQPVEAKKGERISVERAMSKREVMRTDPADGISKLTAVCFRDGSTSFVDSETGKPVRVSANEGEEAYDILVEQLAYLERTSHIAAPIFIKPGSQEHLGLWKPPVMMPEAGRS